MNDEKISNKPIKFRTKDVESDETSILSFDQMYLSKQVLAGLKSAGFLKPSPIQLKAIPLGKLGLDLIVQAKSGTGKTCVFSVIALEHILASNSKGLQVLILAPTREVAVQINEVIKSISTHCNSTVKTNAFIGGQLVKQDKSKLKSSSCQIAVGTPGRILHLISSDILSTSNIRLLILDEADKLLAPEFQESINLIFSKLPDNKQIITASATYPSYMAAYATRYMRSPTWVRLNAVDPSLRGIKQYYKITPYSSLPNVSFDFKVEALINFLSTISFVQAIIFTNYQIKAETLCKSLTEKGWPAIFISGSIEQTERNNAMIQLKQFKCKILVSTDLTSRGIDASNVDLVICMDLPVDAETYLHRIGRAGRYGAQGKGVSFITEGEESAHFETIIDSYDLKIQQFDENLEDIILSRNETKSSVEVDDITIEKASISKEQLDLSLLEYENFKNTQKYLITQKMSNLKKSRTENIEKDVNNEYDQDLWKKYYKSYDEIKSDYDKFNMKDFNQKNMISSLNEYQNNIINDLNESTKANILVKNIKEKLLKYDEELHKILNESQINKKVSSNENRKKQNSTELINLNSLYKWELVDTNKENKIESDTVENSEPDKKTVNINRFPVININSNTNNYQRNINYLNYYSYYYNYYFKHYLNE